MSFTYEFNVEDWAQVAGICMISHPIIPRICFHVRNLLWFDLLWWIIQLVILHWLYIALDFFWMRVLLTSLWCSVFICCALCSFGITSINPVHNDIPNLYSFSPICLFPGQVVHNFFNLQFINTSRSQICRYIILELIKWGLLCAICWFYTIISLWWWYDWTLHDVSTGPVQH